MILRDSQAQFGRKSPPSGAQAAMFPGVKTDDDPGSSRRWMIAVGVTVSEANSVVT